MTGEDFEVLVAVWGARKDDPASFERVLGLVYGEWSAGAEWRVHRKGWVGPMVEQPCYFCMTDQRAKADTGEGDPDPDDQPDPECHVCEGKGVEQVMAEPDTSELKHHYPTNEERAWRSLRYLIERPKLVLTPAMPDRFRTPNEKHLGINMYEYRVSPLGVVLLTAAGIIDPTKGAAPA